MIKNLKIYADTSLEAMAELKNATEYERLDMEHAILQRKKKYYTNRYNAQRNNKTRTVSIDSFMDICTKKMK